MSINFHKKYIFSASAPLHEPFDDPIGNLLSHSSNAATNTYTANNLNQYASISTLCASVPPCELSYDPDGNLLTNGVFSYTYDAASRLAAVSSNGTVVTTFAYDAQGRRVRKERVYPNWISWKRSYRQ